MNPRTDMSAGDERKSEFSPMFLRWIISLTIVTLLFVFVIDPILPGREMRFTSLPWTIAGGVVIHQGLELFSGHELMPIPMVERIMMLGGLLLSFVVGPTLLLFCWRRLATSPKESRLTPAVIGFVFGVIFLSMGMLGTTAGAIIHPRVAASMRSAQDLGENRDQVIAGMWRVSVDAYQYKILPKSTKGGGGSYKGYEMPPDLRKVEANEYVVTSVTDTSVTIMGSSTKYPGAGIQGTYDRHGELRGPFKFMGSFN